MKVDPLTAQRDYLRTIAGRLDAIVVGRMFPDDWHHLRIVKDELQFARERIMERPFPETFDKLIRLENETARLTQDFGLAADSH
jgi:hypothetical protein